MKFNFELRFRFIELWRKIGAKTNPIDVYNLLAAKYSEPHRFYHTLNHLEHCISELYALKIIVPNANEVAFALWFHDYFYNTESHNNEENSANFAVEIADQAGLPVSFSNTVWRLIIATQHAFEPNADDEKFLVDIDLSILGQTEEIFSEYEKNIRKEYSWVPVDVYIRERSKVLQGFLNRNNIFSTEMFREKYEQTARKNLADSIKALSADSLS